MRFPQELDHVVDGGVSMITIVLIVNLLEHQCHLFLDAPETHSMHMRFRGHIKLDECIV